MDCCIQRGADPIRLCPDNPGSACVEYLERRGSQQSERIDGRIRLLNDYSDNRVPPQMLDTVSSVREACQCVIL